MMATHAAGQRSLVVNDALRQNMTFAGAPRSLQPSNRTHSALDIWPDRALSCCREESSTGLTQCYTLVCCCHTACMHPCQELTLPGGP